MATSSGSLLILGASTRAAAWSALRAGFEPICADLFLDTDLQSVARVLPVTTYPAGLEEAVRSLPPTPWMYTGGLENYPELIAAISARHPLCGMSAKQVQGVREPWWLAQTFPFDHPVGVPDLQESDEPPEEGDWLVKPLSASGGRGILRWSPSMVMPDEPVFFQRFIPGRSVSALYLGTEQGVLLLGTAEQLAPQEDVPQFAYCGSVVPAVVPGEILSAMKETGRKLNEEFAVRGLFGCDFILGSDGQLSLLEVNPRYTASVELHEHALHIPLLKWHVAATSGAVTAVDFEEWRSQVEGRTVPGKFWAKRILYATQDFTFPSLPGQIQPLPAGFWDLPRVADIPAPGTSIRRGEPICSVLAWGETEAELPRKLQESEELLEI